MNRYRRFARAQAKALGEAYVQQWTVVEGEEAKAKSEHKKR